MTSVLAINWSKTSLKFLGSRPKPPPSSSLQELEEDEVVPKKNGEKEEDGVRK